MPIDPRTPETVAVIDVSPDATMVTRPCDDTVATLALSVCQAAVLVRSSVVPSDRLALAVNWDVAPGSVKLEVPATVTLEMVAATGEVGGAGATGVGDVGVLLLEHPKPRTARHMATWSAVRLITNA